MTHPISIPIASRLRNLGFTSFFERSFASFASPGAEAGRVAVERRGDYLLLTQNGEVVADLVGRLRHHARARADLPAVGDWVAFRPSPDAKRGRIDAVLPRRTAFVRAEAGGANEAQVVAANIDVVLLVCALGRDLNLRRLERYLALARSSGAEPAVVLTKIDLQATAIPAAAALAEREAVSRIAEIDGITDIVRNAGAPVHAVSSVTGEGIDTLLPYLAAQKTIALLGSSGAGKSTLVNRLIGLEKQVVLQLGSDGRGQHTTTHRELIEVPQGGMLIDTPGMRELRLCDAEEGLDDTFAEIAGLAVECRFRDCAHEQEPGCAVQAALDDGVLGRSRWSSYLKLRRELSVFAGRKNAHDAVKEKRRIKVQARLMRTPWRRDP